MIRRLALALLALAFASGAGAQNYTPGLPFGFKSGFQFLGGAGGFPTPGAVADYDFRYNRYNGPTISVTNSSGGYVDDSQGNWTLVPPNTARRSDKGLLVEGAQTNSIRNNSMQGAVAGTPGTLPTNWTQSNNTGLTPQVVAIGTENGIDYIDLRFAGTATAGVNNIVTEGSTVTAAATGQLWSFSSFAKLVSGSLNNISSSVLIIQELNSSGATVVAGSQGLALTNSPLSQNRSVFNRTFSGGSTVAFTRGYFSLQISAGSVDVTIRLGWPQLEQWSTGVTTVGGASSPIRTTGTAATRAADTLTSGAISGLLSGTLAGAFRNSTLQSKLSLVAAITDGTANNFFRVRYGAGTPTALYAELAAGGATQNQGVVNGSGGDGARHAMAAAFGPGDTALAVDGGAANVAVPASNPPALSIIALSSAAGAIPLFGYIERLAVLPYRASNDNLQRLSTLSNWGG